MSTGWQWREENGVRFLQADYRGLDDAAEHALLLEVTQIVRSEPPGLAVLVYNDDRLPTVEYARVAMDIGRMVFNPRRTRMAILGLPSAAVMACGRSPPSRAAAGSPPSGTRPRRSPS